MSDIRQAANLPENYPAGYNQEVMLKDGSHVLLRPILPADAPRLQYAFSHMSSQTLYMRFLEVFKGLSNEQAHAFANVDYHQHMALVGVIPEDGDERVVVSARYALVGPHQPGVAEAAIIVRDDFQNRGLGKISMLHLARYAMQHGVTAFLATVHLSNARIMHFVKCSGLHFERKMIEPGVWEIRIFLSSLE